ncbi:GNAT family N-acetyltransferase [Shewanella intestini]|uniref:GNAT family N-acetyltransferase n=1 Tax=Shewanella intestini TaxID=2017544 RepID=A0ABS5I656_9GAMM|nr:MULTISPECIES: GNAT family N-acetyltransferase [Shewanella]MBR9729504.1 GNAT family N-acetyltransferase [Shewanella intestini]MRG37567.1 GNAT family N-acetyltransferase [Shewanella sp. XMDDZSB0408]
MHIRLASGLDLEPLSHLLNQYRSQLGQEKDYQACRRFLISRLSENDSIIFVAVNHDSLIGFIQLYPSYSSIFLKPVWHLEDTYVIDEYKDDNIAQQMLLKAKQLADGTEVILINSNEPQQDELVAS